MMMIIKRLSSLAVIFLLTNTSLIYLCFWSNLTSLEWIKNTEFLFDPERGADCCQVCGEEYVEQENLVVKSLH